jgi:hypothetical protein
MAEAALSPCICDVTTTTPPTPRPRRRWLQFSLDTGTLFNPKEGGTWPTV